MRRTGSVSSASEYAFKIVNVINGTQFRGVISDWAGVLTTPLLATVRAWIEADEIDWESYRTVMRAWVLGAYSSDGGPNPIHALERGECSGPEFERLLAAELLRVDGGAVPAEGLLRRMFAASLPDPAMYDTIRALRGAGFRTALLSNSWGCEEYPRADFPELFDAVVISAEVGMRKPEEAIFRHAAQLLDLAPEECVFIDDIEANVNAAVACGMSGMLHTEAETTAAALQDLLGVPLTWSHPSNLVRLPTSEADRGGRPEPPRPT
jgi:putative hydrolase of the HAD superfamily